MQGADRAVSVSQAFLEARLDALYQRDERGRLLFRNQWDAGDAPRFHLMAGLHTSVRGYGAEVPDEIVAAIERLFTDDPPNSVEPGKSGWLPRMPALAAASEGWLQIQQQGLPAWCGPVYRFPKTLAVIDRPNSSGARALRLFTQDTAALRDTMPDWEPDVAHRQPFVAMVEADGNAQAVCASVRIHPALHEAGIETLPAMQKQGYALATATAWARAVRDLGADPVYSTSWHNAASLAVAARLRLEQFAVDYWID